MDFWNREISRRDFLKVAGLASLSLLVPGASGWYTRTQAASLSAHRLVVVMLRGAVDGLSVVVPYGDQNYYEARPKIAVPRPGNEGGALNLDGHFGLNPNMEALMPFWQQKSLAFVHASGSPDNTRSHFDAQDYLESGTPGDKHTDNGWMNRLLGVLPAMHSPTQAVSFTSGMPKILKGRNTVANMSIGRQAGRKLAIDRPQVSAAFNQLYQGNDPLAIAYREGLAARHELLDDLAKEMQMANNGAPVVGNGFLLSARQLATAMVNDANIQLVFTDLGGWDTHVDQGSVSGQLGRKLQFLSEGIAALMTGLGNIYPNTTVVVLSEFGRTVAENGDAGTDHGHGNVIWVAGGNINGGRVYGVWPGLSHNALFEGRDLAITTDFREVFCHLLSAQFGLKATQLNQVFPGYLPSYENVRQLVTQK